jgi:phenolic acid decarboxylase
MTTSAQLANKCDAIDDFCGLIIRTMRESNLTFADGVIAATALAAILMAMECGVDNEEQIAMALRETIEREVERKFGAGQEVSLCTH